MFIVRDYQDGDFDPIAALWLATGIGKPERGDNQRVIEKTLQQGGKLLVLEEKNQHKIVGTSWITNDGRRLLLHHFGVLPEFQGKGLSHKLMKATMKFAREQKMQIKLEVHKTNTTAINLYEKYGFTYLGDYLTYIVREI